MDHHQQQQPSLVELLEQLIMDAAAADADVDADDGTSNIDDRNIKRRLVVVESLLRKDQFPSRQRTTMNELVDDYYVNLDDDIHDMLCDQLWVDDDEYRGLNNERDTVAEVETALRVFPKLLSRRSKFVWDDKEGDLVDAEDAEGDYPIQCLSSMLHTGDFTCNVKGLSFINVLARLAIEYKSFCVHERGGLLINDDDSYNAFENLARGCHPLFDEEHRRRIDEEVVREYVRLRQMNLMKENDIQQYELDRIACRYLPFAINRFRFLVEWCPQLIIKTDNHGRTILHEVLTCDNLIAPFQFVFDHVMRYFPFKVGISLLFQKGGYRGATPFELACSKFQRNQVMDMVEDVLARYSGRTPINTATAFIVAAIDQTVNLDCVYFLLRRQPDVLMTMLITSRSSHVDDINDDENHMNNQDSKEKDNIYDGGDENEDEDKDINKNDYNDVRNRKRKRN